MNIECFDIYRKTECDNSGKKGKNGDGIIIIHMKFKFKNDENCLSLIVINNNNIKFSDIEENKCSSTTSAKKNSQSRIHLCSCPFSDKSKMLNQDFVYS